MLTYLGTICVKGLLLVVQFDGLRIELYRLGPVMRGEGLVALVLESNGFLLWCSHCFFFGTRYSCMLIRWALRGQDQDLKLEYRQTNVPILQQVNGLEP